MFRDILNFLVQFTNNNQSRVLAKHQIEVIIHIKTITQKEQSHYQRRTI